MLFRIAFPKIGVATVSATQGATMAALTKQATPQAATVRATLENGPPENRPDRTSVKGKVKTGRVIQVAGYAEAISQATLVASNPVALTVSSRDFEDATRDTARRTQGKSM